ncbi:carbohydrate kinase family protein [Candidatus Leptofilum sp.]|uniref:carbohydrate kinase family protein n=1 Tax=Candidatus Leptofilum sp. TaxID=3241576 RepID=UPI003B59A4F4
MRIDYLITHAGEARVEVVGGNGLYAAVGAAIWGEPVNLWARIGSNYPHAWLAPLANHQISIEGLVRLPTPQDHRTFFAYLPDGRRDDTNPATHFARIGQPLPAALTNYQHSTPGQDDPYNYEPLALRPEDWPMAWEDVTAVHLSPLALATHLNTPARLRQANVQQITLDPGERYMVPARTAQIKQILPQIDVFLPSAMEMRSLFGDEVDLAEAALTVASWGVPWVVVKNGAKGVLLVNGRSQTITHFPAYHTANDSRIIDVTGAGDSFCGGFMVGLARTGNATQAVPYGLISASLVIEGYGALNALSRQAEALARLADYSKQAANKL